MGRDRISDDEKQAKGTFQPIRAEKETIVRPLSRMPVVPDWLCDEGKRLWKEHGPNLLATDLLTEGDVPSFARYCQFAGLFERYMAEISSGAATIMLPNGIEAANPKFKMALDCQNQADKLGRQFGLSPSARKNVPKTEKKADDNPLSQMLSA